MISVLAILQLLVAIALIGIILIQDPKGGSAGMFGGGGANSVFGATGAPTFLTTLTKWLAAIFAVNCILIALVLKQGTSGSVTDKLSADAPITPPAAATEPVVPTTPPATSETATPAAGTPAPATQKK